MNDLDCCFRCCVSECGHAIIELNHSHFLSLRGRENISIPSTTTTTTVAHIPIPTCVGRHVLLEQVRHVPRQGASGAAAARRRPHRTQCPSRGRTRSNQTYRLYRSRQSCCAQTLTESYLPRSRRVAQHEHHHTTTMARYRGRPCEQLTWPTPYHRTRAAPLVLTHPSQTRQSSYRRHTPLRPAATTGAERYRSRGSRFGPGPVPMIGIGADLDPPSTHTVRTYCFSDALPLSVRPSADRQDVHTRKVEYMKTRVFRNNTFNC